MSIIKDIIGMQTYKYRFTIFTATYNRGSYLPVLYGCIKAQDYQGPFEWVIVSDGSTDSTDQVIASFIEERVVDINYIKIPHGGKHKAWKAATQVFLGRYIVTADDDDPVPANMLSVYDKYWSELEALPYYDQFWEVKSRVSYEDGSLVGLPLPEPYFDSDYIEVNYKLRKGAEMDGCRKVEVLRKEAAVPSSFWFEDKCTNYPEGVRWANAARKYKTRFVPDITRTYVIGHESLCTSTKGKRRSDSRNYNSLVSSFYSIEYCGDLLMKYKKISYFKQLFQLSYSSIRVKERIFGKITHWRDRFFILVFYIPAFVVYKIRCY